MSAPTPATCKRGHERTPENVRVHTLARNGKQRIVRTCVPCWEMAAAARKAAKAAPQDQQP